MNKVKFTVLAIVAAFATTAAASEIEFHGYTRAGVGLSQNGGNGVCFHLNGADTDYRLGNECDYVIEPNFEITMAKLDDKSTWGFHFMPKVYKRWQNMGGRDLDTLAMWVGQVYFYGNNIPWLANGSLWAGRKYWSRLQLGINDQFIENEDSEGFGIENMDFGIGKFMIGFGMNNGSNSTADGADPGDEGVRNFRIATSLTGIQTFNKDSSLQIWAAYYGTSRNKKITGDVKDDAGYRIGVYHNFGFGSAGNLFVGVKLDNDSVGSGAEGSGNDTHLRAFAQYGVNIPAARLGLDVLTEYRIARPDGAKNSDTDAQWYTLGARADFQLSGPFRLLLEAGYDQVKANKDAPTEDLIKITPVFAISAGNDPWSRPTFRFYYTYASWSHVGVLDGWSSTGTQEAFPGKTSGGSFGVQAEGWW